MNKDNIHNQPYKWNRRTFNSTFLMGLPLLSLPLIARNQDKMELTFKRRFPKKLSKGDTIGLLTPASAISKEQLELAIKQITSLGFKVKLGQFVEERNGFLAGTDQQRIQDLHDFFKDSEVAGIWCVRGGYGTTRILPFLDYSIIKKHPKVLIGYSDITALFQGIYQETGLIGFHAPVAVSTFSDYSVKHLKTTLTQVLNQQTISILNPNKPNTFPAPTTLNPGVAEGRITGGNLSLLASLCGTNYEPNYKGKLVFIEDIGEKPYRIDRMLTQIFQATNLNQAAGIIFGVFKNCNPKETDSSWSLLETLQKQTQQFEGPVFYGFSFGHIEDQCVLPIGLNAKFDTQKRTLTLLESPVR